jgi:uncharacterized membrane protein YcaP (DUF421 family)
MNADWRTLLVPTTPLWELFLRGTVMYLGLLAALRVLVRRHIGSSSMMDLLLLVLIADAAQNAMAADYHSLTEGILLCGTLIGWNIFLDWAAYRSDWVARLLEPPPLPVIKNGRMLRRQMKSELLTADDLLSQLRQQGIHDVKLVRIAYLEPDGGLSVVSKEEGPLAASPQQRKKRGPGA